MSFVLNLEWNHFSQIVGHLVLSTQIIQSQLTYDSTKSVA